jgi:hypothetical protein
MILKKVYEGEYKMGPEWESISEEAKQLVRDMLVYDP